MSAETKTMTPPLPAATAPTFTSHQSSSTDDLPRAHIKRLMKHHLSQFTHVDSKTAQPFEPNIAKDALDGVQQACKIFIHYLTSTANDICAESKRSTLSAVRLLVFVGSSFGWILNFESLRRFPSSLDCAFENELDRREMSLIHSFLSLSFKTNNIKKQDDVIRAVREIDFHELEPKLRDHLNQAKTAAAQRQALAASAAERATERSEGAAKKQKTILEEEEEEEGEGDDEMGDDGKEDDDGGEEEEEDE